jgi:hypothetical protein
MSEDHRFRGIRGPTWEKKPYAHYHLDKSDEEIDFLTREILRGYSEVDEIEWQRPLRAKGDARNSGQLQALSESLAWARENKFDWLLHIDVDELLVTTLDDLPMYLARIQSDVYRIRINQKLMVSRWANGLPISYSDLTQSYGVYLKKPKCLHVPALTRTANVHDGGTPIHYGLKVFTPSVSEICFLHFRGTEVAEGSADTTTYVELAGAPTHAERSHLRFLG